MGKPGVFYRKSLRLRGYDYTHEGGYSITLVTHNRECIFGKMVGDQVELSNYGLIAREEWLSSEVIRKEVELFEDEFVIMPNHVHGIVWIIPKDNVGATGQSPLRQEVDVKHGPKPKSLGSFIVGYKTSDTTRVNRFRSSPGKLVWNRNYHDRIIRNERELTTIRKYIQENPLKWVLDRHYIR